MQPVDAASQKKQLVHQAPSLLQGWLHPAQDHNGSARWYNRSTGSRASRILSPWLQDGKLHAACANVPSSPSPETTLYTALSALSCLCCSGSYRNLQPVPAHFFLPCCAFFAAWLFSHWLAQMMGLRSSCR